MQRTHPHRDSPWDAEAVREADNMFADAESKGIIVLSGGKVLFRDNANSNFEKPLPTPQDNLVVERFGRNNMRVADNPNGREIHWKDVPVRMRWMFGVPHLVQKSPEWLECKLHHVSGSEVGSVLGCNPFCSEEDLFELKCNLRPRQLENEAMAHGNKYEAHAARAYAEEMGRRDGMTPGDDVCFEFGFLEHRVYKYLGVSPDRITLSGTAVEIKSPLWRKVSNPTTEEHLKDKLMSYWHQCQMQAAITGVDKIDFVQYGISPNPNHDSPVLSITNVRVDNTWLFRNEHKIRDFWTRVLHYREEHPEWNERSWSHDESLRFYGVLNYGIPTWDSQVTKDHNIQCGF